MLNIELIDAAENGQTEEISGLLEKGAEINHCLSCNGGTALTKAAVKGHTATIRVLLEKGADINGTTSPPGAACDTALTLAAEKGRTETVSVLLEKKADIDHCSSGNNTALLSAAFYGYTGIVRMLLDKRANVNHQNIDGDTALDFSASRGHVKIVRTLLINGAHKQNVYKNVPITCVFSDYTKINKILKKSIKKLKQQEYQEEIKLFKKQKATFIFGLDNKSTEEGTNDDKQILRNDLRPLRKFFSSKSTYHHEKLAGEIISFLKPKPF